MKGEARANRRELYVVVDAESESTCTTGSNYKFIRTTSSSVSGINLILFDHLGSESLHSLQY